MREGDEIRHRDRPDNHCFGCSPHNARGLRMQFESMGGGVVECRYVAEPHWCGRTGVVHGGVQAALLDEAMGFAIHAGLGTDDGPVATVDLRVRFRRPTPTGKPLRVRGAFLRADGADVFVEGSILDSAGRVCTEAEARWKRLAR